MRGKEEECKRLSARLKELQQLLDEASTELVKSLNTVHNLEGKQKEGEGLALKNMELEKALKKLKSHLEGMKFQANEQTERYQQLKDNYDKLMREKKRLEDDRNKIKGVGDDLAKARNKILELEAKLQGMDF